ncbi:hypothetical protein COEREDRAFT_79284 [Coemansia reversa NRRL 1564]|uniref:Uncharacterized protein n=1 Tax=Coemansia reversa (strain ATCC 12441 / NRRL 1564) TaxID=763665 RepID=A0A2G5BK48_COERN|nr:hypothetical protein COEREDRAFT_79284 [Coemansia reversa NRRL 1564]|eukprot:PIA19352.1 hypothetical protein COEREDRAFT_79284 [Coemansia reversa NRRL 1564]
MWEEDSFPESFRYLSRLLYLFATHRFGLTLGIYNNIKIVLCNMFCTHHALYPIADRARKSY